MENRKEKEWDRLLGIRTSGRDDSSSDRYRYPYEPTPYCVLERLAYSGYLGKKNTVIDYGCGKGRVDFFLSYQTGCRTLGIEYNEQLIKKARENGKTARKAGRTEFLLVDATEYQVEKEADRFYFFNPFSVELLRKVMERIRTSFYQRERELLLFFYYPSNEYLSYLMTVEELEFLDEVDCRDLFDGDNPREKILIFQMAAQKFGMTGDS